jgi:hypothetical protein
MNVWRETEIFIQENTLLSSLAFLFLSHRLQCPHRLDEPQQLAGIYQLIISILIDIIRAPHFS